LSLSKLVSPQDALRQKLEARSWKLGKYDPATLGSDQNPPLAGRVSKASIDMSPGAPGTTLNVNQSKERL
jgi:hypothetical protein